MPASEPLYFQEQWEPANLSSGSLRRQAGTVLLFDTGDQIRDVLRLRLQADSRARVNVILVKPGKTFRSFGEQGYTIDPQSSSDYERLFEGLKGRNRMPDSIVHLWSRASYSNDIEKLNDELANSLYSVFNVVQALQQHAADKQVQLLYGFSSSHAEPQPHYAALRGFAATLQKENRKLTCKSVEFRSSGSANNVEGSIGWADILTNELSCDDTNSLEIRYDTGQRYTHRFQEAQEIARNTQESTLKHHGVYLLTGGAGGLGLLFAEYLASKFKARLVLAGRSRVNAAQQARLDSMRSAGAEVIYIEADVARRSDVHKLVTEAKARFGHIDGVIHARGH